MDLQSNAATAHSQCAQKRITHPMALFHERPPVGSIAHGRRLDISTTITAIAGLHAVARVHVVPIVLICIATLLLISTSDAVIVRRIVRCATTGSTPFPAGRIIRRSSSSHGHVRVRCCAALHLANFVKKASILSSGNNLLSELYE